MKKTLLLAISFLFATLGFAQQQLATLNHNDTISVFYGAAALQQAHDSATNGDVILLSSGVFNHINITKPVTIRGNGMDRDTISGTEPTIINGCRIEVPNNNSDYLFLDGVRIASFTKYHSVVNPTFSKCMFDRIEYVDYFGSSMYNSSFINCIIRYFTIIRIYNTQFVNSVINVNDWYEGNDWKLFNSIAFVNPSRLTSSQNNVPDITCTNSILCYAEPVASVNPLASYNCIGVCYNNCSDGFFSNPSNGNQNISGLNTVFKYFIGKQSDNYLPIETNFDLQDSIATNILGNDGTQVGVYGGMVPFTPRVNTPRYVKCNVSPHTTPDGKLSVDVEVVSE
jgi:hypothetical protein